MAVSDASGVQATHHIIDLHEGLKAQPYLPPPPELFQRLSLVQAHDQREWRRGRDAVQPGHFCLTHQLMQHRRLLANSSLLGGVLDGLLYDHAHRLHAAHNQLPLVNNGEVPLPKDFPLLRAFR